MTMFTRVPQLIASFLALSDIADMFLIIVGTGSGLCGKSNEFWLFRV